MGKFKGKAKLRGVLCDKNQRNITGGTWTQSEVAAMVRSAHNPAHSFVGYHCGTGEGVAIIKTGVGEVKYL